MAGAGCPVMSHGREHSHVSVIEVVSLLPIDARGGLQNITMTGTLKRRPLTSGFGVPKNASFAIIEASTIFM